jgi:hypothetical protein
MTPVTVIMESIGSDASISIKVIVKEASTPVEFRNLAMGNPGQQNLAEFGNPYLSDAALEIACCTGARYVRWPLGIQGLSVELLAFDCRGNIQDMEPFAMAIAIAAFRTFGKEPEPAFNGWKAF